MKDKFSNGSLKDFRIEDLIERVKETREATNSFRTDNRGNTYFIVVGGSFDTNLKTGENATLDVIVEYENGDEERILTIRKASNWNEIIKTFNSWKNIIRDSNYSQLQSDLNELYDQLIVDFDLFQERIYALEDIKNELKNPYHIGAIKDLISKYVNIHRDFDLLIDDFEQIIKDYE